MKKLLLVLTMLPLLFLNGCEVFDKCDETEDAFPTNVSVAFSVINKSHSRLINIHAYGYKHHCSGSIGNAHFAMGNINYIGGSAGGSFTFKRGNTQETFIVKIEAVSVDENGTERKETLSRTFNYASFDYGNIANVKFEF